jgi:hypothetical protein
LKRATVPHDGREVGATIDRRARRIQGATGGAGDVETNNSWTGTP